MNHQKQVLREEAKKARARIVPKGDEAEKAGALFFDHFKPDQSVKIAAYWPMTERREFDPRDIIDEALRRGHICAYPVIEKDNRVLKFGRYDANTDMEEGAYGIPQPITQEFITPDIIFVPLLAFDRKGHRLGYGGGFYDATLAHSRALNPELLAVGIGYAEQACLFNLPAEEHDESLDFVLTPLNVITPTEVEGFV